MTSASQPVAGPSLRPYQLAGIEQLREHIRSGRRRLVLEMPTGSGKCLGYGTPVILADGRIIPVQDVRVGDQLLGPDGGVRNVLSLARGRELMYRVAPVKGDPYIVNASHILSLRKTPGGYAIIAPSGRRIGEFEDVVNLNVQDFASGNKTLRHNLKGWRSGAVEFTRQPCALAIPPYILGAWLGDGHEKDTALSKPMCRMVSEWVEYANSLGLEIKMTLSGHGGCPTWRATQGARTGKNNVLRDLLREVGVFGGKCIPDDYKFAPLNDRLELIAGLLDSDGYLGHSGYDWISKSEFMANDFAFVCRSVGLAAYVSKTVKGIKATGFSGVYWRVSVSGDCERIPCRDKAAHVRTQKKRHLVHGISVEPIGEGDYYGFEIDGDHLFLLGDFTVTHNTKTALAMVQSAVARGGRVMFCVNRTQLLDQTVRVFEAQGLDVGVVQGANTRNLHRRVLVVSIATLARRPEHVPDDLALLVIDEAHAVGGDSRYHSLIAKVHNMAPRCAVIGLSATPWSKGMARHVEELGGPLMQAKVTPTSALDLIAEGFLVDADIYAPGAPDMTGVKTVAGEYNEGQAAERMDKPELIGDIVTTWLKHGQGKQTVAFGANIAHSQHIAQAFNRVGIDARHLDHNVPQAEKNELLAAFDRKEFLVLCNPLLLREGWDCPSVEVLILARPTKSLISYVQICGRVLRPAPGKQNATIIDHSGTCLRLGMPTDDRSGMELDDGKPKSGSDAEDKEKEEALPKPCPNCHFLKPAKTPICPACGHQSIRPTDVQMLPGELSLVAKSAKHKPSDLALRFGSKQQTYSMLLGVARDRKYNYGWVARKYRDVTGVWPRGLSEIAAEPSPDILTWIKAEARRWAKEIKQSEQGAWL